MPDTATPVLPIEPPSPMPASPVPEMKTALRRGVRGVCPVCGAAPLFAGWLKVVDTCANCGTHLGEIRADDAPPYFTIFAVGHIIIPGMLWLERAHAPELWVHMIIWVPLTLALSLALMRPVKGATIGLMLKLGFGRPAEEA